MCRQRLEPDQAVAAVLGPDRLALVQERLQLEGRQLSLVEPMDVDAVMDMYIKRGESLWCPGERGLCFCMRRFSCFVAHNVSGQASQAKGTGTPTGAGLGPQRRPWLGTSWRGLACAWAGLCAR